MAVGLNVPGLIPPIQRSKKQAENEMITVHPVEMIKYNGTKKSRTECVHLFSAESSCFLIQNFI